MKHAKPVLCAVRVGFMSLWMTFSFLKFIEKNREQTKKYNGVILGSIHPKNERNYQNIGKKKKKGRKILKPAF